MNPVQIIATLRKFGNYLAGLFPFLVVIVDFFSKQLGKLADSPLLAPIREKLKENKFAQSVWKITERFYWRTYSKDRLDLEGAPPATLGLLRPVFQICALLCILIPVTQFDIQPVPIEAFSGFKGTAPAWSVVLWMLSLPFAWAALLVGTAISNRIAFSLTAAGAAYFLTTCVVLLPRSFFNALISVAIVIALGLCERSLKTESRASKILSVVNSAIAGIAAAIPLIILTPIRPYLGTIINLPGPVISIGGGALVGTIIGLATLAWSKLPEKPEGPFLFKGAPPNLSAIFWTLASLLMGYVFAGIARGDLGQSGSMLISSLALTTTYFWPVWYFIGVGILHKLMGSSKVLATSIEGMMPEKILTPFMVLVLIAALMISYSETLALQLTYFAGFPAEVGTHICYRIYTLTKPFIWSNPLNVMTVHWLTWVFLFDALVLVVLAFQKRLTSASIARLLFLTCLAALLIWEYVFQMSSFLRGPGHSVIGLFLFATWLLWLMHTVGWSLSTKSSPCWPSAGRLAVYSGIAAVALLDIHARSACKDFKLMNELFLTMFRGVIDFGLPYYFLVWTTKKVENIPVKISTLLGLFTLGVITSFGFNVLEKLAAADWSFPQTLEIAMTQCELLRTTGSINIDLNLPMAFFVARALNYIGLLALVFIITRAKLGSTTRGSKAILFVLVAFASGIAAFSKTLLELPVPPEVRAFLAPNSQELLFNCTLFQSYLAYWIPVLLLGVAQIGKDGVRRFLLLAPVAVATHFLISWGYYEFETYFRACGSLYTVMSALGGVFVLLVVAGLQRLKRADDDMEKPEDENRIATLLTPKSLVALVIAAELVLIPLSIAQSNLRFGERQTKVLGHNSVLATSWIEQPAVPGNNSFITYSRPEPHNGSALLSVGALPSNPKGTAELMKQLVMQAIESKMYPNLTVIAVEPWGKYYPNALACHFSHDVVNNGVTTMTMSGITVLVPRHDDLTECYSLRTMPSEIGKEQAELALTIRKLRESLKNHTKR